MSYFIDHDIKETRSTVVRDLNPSTEWLTEPALTGSQELQIQATLSLYTQMQQQSDDSENSILQHIIQQLLNEYEDSVKGPPPASKEFISNLKSSSIKGTSCSICLDAVDEGLVMPCTHSFHKACVIPWLELHNTCPVCRKEFPTDEPKVEAVVEEEQEEEWDPFFG